MLPIVRRPFGRHSDLVSIIGLGGYHLGKPKTIAESVRIIHAAIDAGVNFLDNAWEYHEGESESGWASASPVTRPDIHLRMLAFDYPFDACQLPRKCRRR